MLTSPSKRQPKRIRIQPLAGFRLRTKVTCTPASQRKLARIASGGPAGPVVRVPLIVPPLLADCGMQTSSLPEAPL